MIREEMTQNGEKKVVRLGDFLQYMGRKTDVLGSVPDWVIPQLEMFLEQSRNVPLKEVEILSAELLGRGRIEFYDPESYLHFRCPKCGEDFVYTHSESDLPFVNFHQCGQLLVCRKNLK